MKKKLKFYKETPISIYKEKQYMRLLDRVQNLEYNKGKTLREIDICLFETVVKFTFNPSKYEKKLTWLLQLHERGI